MKSKNINILHWDLFKNHPIKTGITTRSGGVSSPPYSSFNLAKHTGDNPITVDLNRKILTDYLGSPIDDYLCVNQVHSDDILVVHKNHNPKKVFNCDAIITDVKEKLLNIFVADCVPITIYDPVKNVGGLCHCGWKGTKKQLLPKTIKSMQSIYKSDIKDLIIGIGPSIGLCCYAVSNDLYADFNPKENEGIIISEKHYLNLREINRNQILKMGIKAQNIEVMDLCTKCNNDLFYSHREEGEPSGRFSCYLKLTS